jgi:hypothetical protein
VRGLTAAVGAELPGPALELHRVAADRITEHVVGALEPGLQKAEIARATTKPTESLASGEVPL